MNARYAIDRKEIFESNGVKYHLRIRSSDAANPVVLFLHGGVGSPDRGQVIKFQTPLADSFTLVAWDQRGSGYAYTKSDKKNFASITKDVYVEDAHRVVNYLKSTFNKDKIIVVGHSFGSVLGIWLAQKYPTDIAAYVGIGQCVDYVKNEEDSYNFVLEESARIGDSRALSTLKEIGCPQNGKYKGNHQRSIMKQRAILHKLGGATYNNRKAYWRELLFHDVPIMLKEYSISGLVKYLKGLAFLPKTPLASTNPDFMNTAKSMDVPVYLLLGHHDYNCSYKLAEAWYEALEAPEKKLIWFEDSAHSPQWEEPDKWNDAFKNLFAKSED